jgi:hypothetical protein
LIVISGALVLIAAVLLVLGIALPELNVVYASIGVSLLAFAFLIVGVLQRRGEAPAGASEPSGSAEAPRLKQARADGPSLSKSAPAPTAALPTQEPVQAVAQDAPEGLVLVVAGRPRYHADGCRYLADKDVEEVDVTIARSEGYTACGVCKPDAVLAQRAPVAPVVPVVPAADAPAEAAPEAPVEPTKRAPRKLAAAKRTATTAPAETAAELAAPATPVARKTAAKAATKAVTPPAPAAAAAAKPAAKRLPAKAPSALVPDAPVAAKATRAPARTAAKAPASAAAKATPVKAPAAPVKAAKAAAKAPAKVTAKKVAPTRTPRA